MGNIATKSQFKNALEYTIMYSGISSYPSTESGKERIEIAEMIMEELKRKKSLRTVSDLQISNERLCEYSNQKISAILKALVNNGNVESTNIDKKTYFSISSNNEKTNISENLLNFFETFCVENSNEIVDMANDKYEKKEQFENTKKLDKENLLKYLNTLIELNSDIYSLQQRYDSLRNLMMEEILENVPNFNKINNNLIKEKENILIEIQELNKSSEPIYEKEIKIPLPEKKQKPTLKINKPEEPKYLVPNFFNKKKVQTENERLKNDYNKNIEKYNIEYKKYTEKLNEYNQYLADYEKEVEEIKNKEKVLNDENYNKKLREYDKVKEKNNLILKEKNSQLQAFEDNYYSKLDEKLLENESYKNIKKIKYELDYINLLLYKDIELENKLYSYGIIYGKYRNFVAITSFYDYLMSSRCEELEGTNGAYNLFEQESRSNIIVEKLDKIISSLEEIKSMQYCIYNQMNIINKSLDLINNQLLVNNLLQTVQISQLNEIIGTTKEIAYNTKVSAYYSQKIANYTKALTILTFLK